MQSKKKKILIFSILALSVAALFLVAGTLALFSDSVPKTHHLQAGSLKIGLYRTSLTGKKLEADGTLGDYSNTERVDLTKTDAKIFEMNNVCPLAFQTATLEVSNLGTTAFTYSVTVTDVVLDTENETAAQALAAQIKITVTKGGEDTYFFLSEIPQDGKTVSLGSMLVTDQAQTFTVKAEFVEDGANNDAMNANLSFDLIVNAMQATN